VHGDTLWNTAVIIGNKGNIIGKHRKARCAALRGRAPGLRAACLVCLSDQVMWAHCPRGSHQQLANDKADTVGAPLL
jgi:hypothetical protein